MKTSELIGILQYPVMCGIGCAGMSLLVTERIDPVGLLAGVICFMTMSADSIGRNYLLKTNATDVSVKLFNSISQPILTLVLLLSFGYVFASRFHPIFVGLAIFITFIILVIGVTDYQAVKKKEKDGE